MQAVRCKAYDFRCSLQAQGHHTKKRRKSHRSHAITPLITPKTLEITAITAITPLFDFPGSIPEPSCHAYVYIYIYIYIFITQYFQKSYIICDWCDFLYALRSQSHHGLMDRNALPKLGTPPWCIMGVGARGGKWCDRCDRCDFRRFWCDWLCDRLGLV